MNMILGIVNPHLEFLQSNWSILPLSSVVMVILVSTCIGLYLRRFPLFIYRPSCDWGKTKKTYTSIDLRKGEEIIVFDSGGIQFYKNTPPEYYYLFCFPEDSDRGPKEIDYSHSLKLPFKIEGVSRRGKTVTLNL